MGSILDVHLTEGERWVEYEEKGMNGGKSEK